MKVQYSSDNKSSYAFLIIQSYVSRWNLRNGESSSLTIGSLDICRDWSYAEEIAKGIIDITLNGTSGDYVLGSGIGSTIEQLVNNVFTFFDLDYKQYINLDISILRKKHFEYRFNFGIISQYSLFGQVIDESPSDIPEIWPVINMKIIVK